MIACIAGEGIGPANSFKMISFDRGQSYDQLKTSVVSLLGIFAGGAGLGIKP
jgi:hypothetical protein